MAGAPDGIDSKLNVFLPKGTFNIPGTPSVAKVGTANMRAVNVPTARFCRFIVFSSEFARHLRLLCHGCSEASSGPKPGNCGPLRLSRMEAMMIRGSPARQQCGLLDDRYWPQSGPVRALSGRPGLTQLGLWSWKSVCPGATADRGPTLRSQLNRSSLKQINEDALNTTSPHANALIY